MNTVNATQRRLGPPLILGGSAVVLLASLLIDWISISEGGQSDSEKLWHLTTGELGHRQPILLFILIALTLVLAAAFMTGQVAVKWWLGAVGLVQFGCVLDLSIEFAPASHNSAAGGWVALAGGLAVAVGSAMVVGLRPEALSGVASGLREAAGGAASGVRSTGAGAGGASLSGTSSADTSTGAGGGMATPDTTSTGGAVGGAPLGATPAGGGTVGGAGLSGAGSSAASDETTDVSSSPAPGWYPDPSGQHKERLWDGISWTDDVR